jgi:SSS family solute:Na+ symporter
MWGFSLKELLIAQFIAPRMEIFRNQAETIGDIMQIGFGRTAKIITGIASVLVCSGILGAQVAACGNILYTFLGIPNIIGSLVTAAIVLFYATIGGLVSVIAADILHFSILIIMLPIVMIFGFREVGGIDVLINNLPEHHFEIFGDIGFTTFLIIFLSFFFGETLIPPYVQRLLIGKTQKDTYRGTLYSALLSLPFFFIIGMIGLIALHLNNTISPSLALPFTIKEVMPVGLKGLAVVAMLAVIMSSADSFLNATSIALKQDILEPIGFNFGNSSSSKLFASKMITFFIGALALIFSLSSKSAIDILLYSYEFWTPFILVPLIAVIFGVRSQPSVFTNSAICGILSLLFWNFFEPISSEIDSALEGVLFGILINAIAFFYFLNKASKKTTQIKLREV